MGSHSVQMVFTVTGADQTWARHACDRWKAALAKARELENRIQLILWKRFMGESLTDEEQEILNSLEEEQVDHG